MSVCLFYCFFCDSYYFSEIEIRFKILVFCFAVYNLLFSRFHNLLFRKKKLGLNVSVNLIFLVSDHFFFKESRDISPCLCVLIRVCVRPCLFRYGFVTERVRAVPWMLVVEYLKVIDLVIVKVNVVQRLVSLQRLEVHLVA